MYDMDGLLEACSLYPSAMYYMDGLLEGLPKVLTNLSHEFLKQHDGFLFIINIIKLHKHLDFPLTNKIDEDGVRNFTNNMDKEIIYIDKTGLEDLIEFQKADFHIIDGYVFLTKVELKLLIMLLNNYII